MRMMSTFILSLALMQAYSLCAEQQKDSSFLSFKELGEMFDEQLNILAETVEKMQPVSLHVQALQDNDFAVKVVGDQAEIQIKVPHVENSEEITAHVNAKKDRSKVIVPQKGSITKVIISKDHKNVRKITSHRSEERHTGKQGSRYHMSASRHMEIRSLPFDVDISQQKVEYKENDMLVITVSKAQEAPVIKAQPRIIPVTNK